MVNMAMRASHGLGALNAAVRAYVVVVLATLGVLAILSVAAPGQAPPDAWVHALIVAGFAVLLPLRLRVARRGRGSALRAVGLIASILLLVNVVEALIPGFVPIWMRIEMVGIAALMAVIVLLVVRERV